MQDMNLKTIGVKSNQIIKANPEKQRDSIDVSQGFLEVSEFFYDTIQGEGINTGVPATFLRLQNCTLNCRWCFGIKNGRRVPKIMTLHGNNKKINEVCEGDVLLTFDQSTKQMVETTVINVLSRCVTKWQEIKAGDKIYFVTSEHPFFCTDGNLKRADQLKAGDEIYHSTGKQKSSYRMKKENPMYNEVSVRKVKDNTDWKKLGEKVSKAISRKKKEGTYIPAMTILKETDPDKYSNIIKDASDRMKKEGNPNWKGGLSQNYNLLKNAIKESNEYKCSDCASQDKLEVHHIDNNPLNDSVDNLDILCHKCHSNKHKRGFNFWNGKRKDGKVSTTNAEEAKNGILVHYNKTVNIKEHPHFGKSYGPKKLPVYNLTCAPYNSYLVDNMWVHNCDTGEVWREGNPYTFNELFKMMEEVNLIEKLGRGQHLVLTGGSPLKQQFALISFITRFVAFYGFKPYIEIENECTVMPSDKFAELIDCWNNSPKLSNSGNSDIARYKPKVLDKLAGFKNSWFKFVITDENDWTELQRDFINTNLIARNQVILMPQGATRKELSLNRKSVIDIAIRENVRYSTREHIVIWDKKTGV